MSHGHGDLDPSLGKHPTPYQRVEETGVPAGRGQKVLTAGPHPAIALPDLMELRLGDLEVRRFGL